MKNNNSFSIEYRIGTFSQLTNDKSKEKKMLFNDYNKLNEICFNKPIKDPEIMDVGTLFLGYHHDILVTMATGLDMDGDYILIYNVGVHPEYRRRGLCYNIIRNIISHFFNHNTFKLDVYKNNTAAYRCYHKIGFRPDISASKDDQDVLVYQRK